jgi:hypothetical protein
LHVQQVRHDFGDGTLVFIPSTHSSTAWNGSISGSEGIMILLGNFRSLLEVHLQIRDNLPFLLGISLLEGFSYNHDVLAGDFNLQEFDRLGYFRSCLLDVFDGFIEVSREANCSRGDIIFFGYNLFRFSSGHFDHLIL